MRGLEIATNTSMQRGSNGRGCPPPWQKLPPPHRAGTVTMQNATTASAADGTDLQNHVCRRCEMGLEPTEPSLSVSLLYGSAAPDSVPLSQAQIRNLISREITPEDYEMLLRLDEGITKKSGVLSEEDCAKLPLLEAAAWEGEECAVCLDELSAADEVQGLPCCNHAFHKECIVQWLTRSKAKCPLDNLEVVVQSGPSA